MHSRSKLLVPVILLIAAVLIALQLRDQLVVSAQSDDSYRWLYDDDELLDQLSGAARTGLEMKFGKKGKDRGAPSKPLRGKEIGGGKAAKQGGGGDKGSPIGDEPLAIIDNTLVNNATSDLTAQDTQSETALVLGSGSSVVSAFNDSGSFIGGARRFTGFSHSTDGALSWTDKGTLPSGSDGDLGDPVLARSSVTGTIFLSTLSFNTRQNLLVFRSTDNGAALLAPVNGAPGFVAGQDLQDKEWIAADNFPGPGQGNVYLVWRNFSNAGRNNIYFTRSTDDGLSWGPNGGTVIDSFGQGAFVTVGSDHAVYVFWWNANSGPFRITMRKSTDLGATFGPITTVATLAGVGVNGDLGLSGGFRSNSFPQAVVNPVNGNIYVVYNDRTSGLDRGNIYFTQSTDGGSTWSAGVGVNDDGTLNDQFMPALAVTPDGTKLCVSFYDRRRDPLNSMIDRFGSIGSISGSTVTFGPNFLITTQSFPVVRGVDPVVNTTYMGDYDMMAADAGFFYSTWGDNRDPSIAVPARKNANVRSAKIPVAGPGQILAVSGTPLPTGGNGNGVVDSNECNNLNFTIRNFGSSTATGVSATLSTSTPGVSITQPTSTYPDIAVGNKATNSTSFQMSTSPSFPCGTSIDLTLTVSMAGGGTSILPFTMITGAPAVATPFNSSGPVPIPDLGTVDSPITVSGIPSSIADVNVSLFISHSFDNDLVIRLVGPDGTTIDLSNRNGGSGLNYGVACIPDTSRTMFDDSASTPIASGSPPFVGTFQPEQPLSAFVGKSGAGLNGTWRLRVTDAEGGDSGTIQCWSLVITPTACVNGGGTCSAFLDPNSVILADPNANGLVDPNECSDLTISLRNVGITGASGITAVLSSSTPDLTVLQQASAYPDISVGATGSNSTPFKLLTTASFRCGTFVKLILTVTTNEGRFIVAINLASGSPGGTSTFASTDVPKAIPDAVAVGVESIATVSGVTGSVTKVTVSLHITHTFVADLDFLLVGPDGTTIVLSSGNGGGGFNYGASCTNRTIFDDSAATSITQGFAPFVGTFRPEQPLSNFSGKSGTAVNGTWRLRVIDRVFTDIGTLQCWSLSISQVTCPDGGAVSISPTNQSFPVEGGTGSVAVTAQTDCAWTATSNATWLTITSGSSGTGNGTVNYSVAASGVCTSRIGEISINGILFSVTQAGLPCTFTLSATSQNFVGAGGMGSVNVTTTNTCCAWTATTVDPWITVTAGGSGTGNGTVSFSVAANTNCTGRSGSITIAGQTFTVTQDPHNCTFSISPTGRNFVASTANDVVALTASSSCCVWTATSNDSWITVTSGSSGAGNGTVRYSVSQNTAPTPRTGTITIAGLTFTVFQGASGGDSDADGIPDSVELAEGRNPFVKDNDIFSNARLFAMQQYRDFLGREGDPGGIGFWTTQISTGAQTRAQVIQSFFGSAEFQNTTAPVARLYFAYFLRIPDFSGLTFWVNQFKTGTSLRSISEAFAGSPEFISRYGSLDNTQFVTLVYTNVLGRAPDATGLAFWVGQLNGGLMTRGQVMLAFSESAEYKAAILNEVFVTQIYAGMLRRSADQAGFDFWVGQLDGGASGLGLIQGFLGSIEYRNRFLPPAS